MAGATSDTSVAWVPRRGHSPQECAGGHGSRATWIPAPQVRSPCHRDRSLIQGMNAERWLDVLADFPTVDEEAESISGTVSLGVDPGTTDGWAWGD